jgi:poly(glycerol-phosphate) alpha-glucosyltransferase
VGLPRGRHFAVTWGIPRQPGGMTRALVYRSRLFAAAGRPVSILTFELRDDPVRSIGDVPVVNIWEWLRENAITVGPRRHSAAATGTRHDGEGRLLQIDHYRADGSLAVIDRRDTRVTGVVGGRTIVLCDERGRPVRSFGRAWALYRWWLDEVTAHQRSFLIVDSKTAANPLMTYHRPHATVVHLVHNTHLTTDGSALRPSRRRVFENLEVFDAVVLLTRSQRRDVGSSAKLAVIPNSIPLRPRSNAQRHGVVALASLTPRKRVDHAIRAAALASVPLEVYGDGPLRDELERRGGEVVFHGHLPDASERLATASVILLTGDAEGLPLVLLESMAAGCIPIAYDVRYGPADVIRNGRNGYLVASGDVAALAAALTEFLALTPHAQRRMRAAARRAAARYSDAAVLRRWSRVLRRAARRSLTRRDALASLRLSLTRWRRRAPSGG